jgi:4-carboxymuconolactone decarboxylase
MTVLDMSVATLPADAQALFATMAARRKARGEGFGGPYLALLNHPELAHRVEELGFFLKFEGALPRTIYQFIVLTVARSTGAAFEWQDHIAHARAAGLPEEVIDCIGSSHISALASEASGQRANSMVRAHSASEDARERAGDTRPEAGSLARDALPKPYALAHAILEKTMAWQAVPDDLQARAAAEWGKHGLVEIVVLSGFYQMFAAINQGFDISEVSGR